MEFGPTMAPELQVDYVADAHIDDSEEALVPLLELALVKYLDRYDRRVFDSADA